MSRNKEVEYFLKKLTGYSETECSIIDLKFYIMSFNILCNISETEYIPIEFGIAKYSIKLGIEDVLHRFIHPGTIPGSYTGLCKEISKSTHNIPITGFSLASNNYNEIHKSMMNFINPKQQTVVTVFCMDNEIQQNMSCLEWLRIKSKAYCEPLIIIYDLTWLLTILKDYVDDPFPSDEAAANAVNNHAFDYVSNTGCNFHEKLDNNFCALSKAKRLCFILSSNLCKLYKIPYTHCHIPMNKPIKIMEKPSQISNEPRQKTVDYRNKKNFQQPRNFYSNRIARSAAMGTNSTQECLKKVCSSKNENRQMKNALKSESNPFLNQRKDKPCSDHKNMNIQQEQSRTGCDMSTFQRTKSINFYPNRVAAAIESGSMTETKCRPILGKEHVENSSTTKFTESSDDDEEFWDCNNSAMQSSFNDSFNKTECESGFPKNEQFQHDQYQNFFDTNRRNRNCLMNKFINQQCY